MGGTYDYELGSQIDVNEGELAAAATGWTLENGSINKIGKLVALHLEFSAANDAAAHAYDLPNRDYWPDFDVHSPDGKWTISSTTGQITYSGSTTGGVALAVLDVVYDPWHGG
jgi:hypothetical protein